MNSISRHRRLSLPIVAVVAAVVALTGCSSSANSKGTAASIYKGITIDYVSGPLINAVFTPMNAGAMQAARDFGVKVKWIPVDIPNLVATSATTMQTAIADKPSAIVVGDFVPSTTDPLIKQAIAAGIPVTLNQSGLTNWQADGAFGYIGSNPDQVGNVAGTKLATAGAKSIVCVNPVPGNPLLDQICTATNTGAQVLGAHSVEFNLPNGDSSEPSKVTADIGAYLKSHPDVTGVFTLWGDGGDLAVSAVQSANLGRKVSVGSFGIANSVVKDIKSGTR
jgi:simple sugar transport system substrate-binding protein